MAKDAVQKYEYGFVAATIGVADSESTLSKKSFLARIEQEYPSADGWEVYQVTSVPLQQTWNGMNMTLPYVTYHLRRGA